MKSLHLYGHVGSRRQSRHSYSVGIYIVRTQGRGGGKGGLEEAGQNGKGYKQGGPHLGADEMDELQVDLNTKIKTKFN